MCCLNINKVLAIDLASANDKKRKHFATCLVGHRLIVRNRF